MMTPYQVVIEGVFVAVTSEADCSLGFHSTFYVMANSASNAVHRTRSLIAARMRTHAVKETNSFSFFKTHYVVHDIWEVTEQKFEEQKDRDLGFTFFRIRLLERLHLAIRYQYLKRVKPWRLVGNEVKA
jgi:hypothetical protein